MSPVNPNLFIHAAKLQKIGKGLIRPAEIVRDVTRPIEAWARPAGA